MSKSKSTYPNPEHRVPLPSILSIWWTMFAAIRRFDTVPESWSIVFSRDSPGVCSLLQVMHTLLKLANTSSSWISN